MSELKDILGNKEMKKLKESVKCGLGVRNGGETFSGLLHSLTDFAPVFDRLLPISSSLRTPHSELRTRTLMPDLIAEIAVNVAVNKTFHYLVPDAIAGRPRSRFAGARPFRQPGASPARSSAFPPQAEVVGPQDRHRGARRSACARPARALPAGWPITTSIPWA